MPDLVTPGATPGATPTPTTMLEAVLGAVELRLAALGTALREHDITGIDLHASELHTALASAVDHFTRAAREGGVPVSLRLRLSQASGQVAAQRESLARATAAYDRAIDVLLPRDASGLYSTHGGTERSARIGVLLA